VDELRPERHLDRSPIFETMFIVDNNPNALRETVVIGNLRIRRRVIHTGTAKFDLSLSMFRKDGGRRLSIEYRTDLFTQATATRLLHQYVQLLERIVAEPDARIADLARPLIPASTAWPQEWQGRRTPYPRNATIAQLFESQAGLHRTRQP